MEPESLSYLASSYRHLGPPWLTAASFPSWPLSSPAFLPRVSPCVSSSFYKDTSHWIWGPPNDLVLPNYFYKDLIQIRSLSQVLNLELEEPLGDNKSIHYILV